MQNRKALRTLATVILLLTLVWIFAFFFQSILKENSNSNILLVPDDATFALRLDGREIAEHTLFSVFLESKDKEVLKLMQESITRKMNKDGKWKNYGIDYMSDIVLFEVPFKGQTIHGLLVNVSNDLLFRINMKSTGKIFAYSDGVGLILTSNEKPGKISNAELTSFAEKTISRNQSPVSSAFKANRGSGKFIETYKKGIFFGDPSYFGQSNILFELQKQSLLLSGKINLNQDSDRKLKKIEKRILPQGLHCTSTIFPSGAQDSLAKFLKQFSISIPKIEQISMNYMGTKIINHSTGFFVVPQIEMLVSCQSEVSIQQILSSPELITFFEYQLNNNSISFQEETLYFNQVTPSSFYIGINQNPKYEAVHGEKLMKIEGNLKPLTHISHINKKSIITAFIEIMPIYRASKNFSSNTESIDLEISGNGMKEFQLKGNLAFSKGHYPMNELVKFLLIGQLIQ